MSGLVGDGRTKKFVGRFGGEFRTDDYGSHRAILIEHRRSKDVVSQVLVVDLALESVFHEPINANGRRLRWEKFGIP